MVLYCRQHGNAVWGGAVTFPKCNAIYQTHDEKAERYAPEFCCGVRFMPTDPNKLPSEDGTALAACNACAKKTGLALPEPEMPS